MDNTNTSKKFNTNKRKVNNTGSKRGSSSKGQTGLNYTNTEKLKKNFMYQDLRKSHCYDCDFSESNFDYTSFRGAHMKSCNFYGASFKAAEFVGSNLKKSRFKKARFEDVVFEGANLDGVDFAGAVFRNTIFIGTDVTQAKNLNTISVNITVYDEMPPLEISEELTAAVQEVMENKYVKASRVLDTKDGEINSISMMRLLKQFEEKTIIKGFGLMKGKIDNDFCTLSYIIKFLARHEEQGLI
ncbi:MAG: pentapeptide repeat-containing protein [Cellulosilyticaceae bacterium]